MEAREIIELLKEDELERWNMYVASIILQKDRKPEEIDFDLIDHSRALWCGIHVFLVDTLKEDFIGGDRRYKIPEWYENVV